MAYHYNLPGLLPNNIYGDEITITLLVSSNVSSHLDLFFYNLTFFLKKIYVWPPGRLKLIFGPWGSAPGLMAPR